MMHSTSSSDYHAECHGYGTVDRGSARLFRERRAYTMPGAPDSHYEARLEFFCAVCMESHDWILTHQSVAVQRAVEQPSQVCVVSNSTSCDTALYQELTWAYIKRALAGHTSDSVALGRADVGVINHCPELCVDNSVIIGDANRIFGNHNLLIGNRNAAWGDHNRARGDSNLLVGRHCTNCDTGRYGAARGGFSARIQIAQHRRSAAGATYKRLLPLSVSDPCAARRLDDGFESANSDD
jgi:hypothetical protein